MLGVAGLMSAKASKNQVKEEKMPNKNGENKIVLNLQAETSCFLLHYRVGFRVQPAVIIRQNLLY